MAQTGQVIQSLETQKRSKAGRKWEVGTAKTQRLGRQTLSPQAGGNSRCSPGLGGPPRSPPPPSLDTHTHPILKLYNEDSFLFFLPFHSKTSLGFTIGPKVDQLPTQPSTQQ